MRLVLLVPALLLAPAAAAQVGIGGLIGDPTGLTVRLGGSSGGVAVDIGLKNDLFVQGHYLLPNNSFRGSLSDARFLFGPGVFYQERPGDDAIGASALFGLAVYVAPKFEVFGQVTPGIELTPDVDSTVGAAVGLLFYP